MTDRNVALETLLEAVRLKALRRAGWVRVGALDPESVADHSWGVAWLVLALLPAQMNRERALAYAVLHDLPEVRVGDITPVDGVSKAEKSRREHDAMIALSSGLRDPELLRLWEAYEAQADPESRFVRQLDRLDMALQALAQHEQGVAGMQEFVESADAFITDPTLRGWMDAVMTRFRRSAR
ncbi:MAG: HD domain-containing protein [Myxococcota bacterium]